MNMKREILLIWILVFLGIESVKSQSNTLDNYNITWTEQSKNSSESMPLGGGDIGCKMVIYWCMCREVGVWQKRMSTLSWVEFD